MATILQIDSSIRGPLSTTKLLTKEFVEAWTAVHPGDTVVTRDLAADPIPYIDLTTVFASYTPSDKRTPEQVEALKLSEALVDELFAADVIVIGAPMYNFGVPAGLKSYIDFISRAGRTFAYGEKGIQGLVTGKKAFVFGARGGAGYNFGEPMAGFNFQDTYLKAVLGFIGITDVTFINVDNTSRGEELLNASLALARAEIKAAV